ncbi:MAG: hypothetical protein IJ751_06805 [Oscillospiraceae bacterium]|nr:hypothetical protein [Oscillospiraceae bacterium]
MEALIVLAALIIQRAPVQMLRDAFLCTPVGGAVDLAGQFVPYAIRSLRSVDQLYADAATVDYAMHHIPELLEENSVWLISCIQFFSLEWIVNTGREIGVKRPVVLLHSILFSLAFGVVGAFAMDALVWSETGAAAYLFSSGGHGVLYFLAVAAAVVIVLTLLLLDLYLLLASFYEMLLVLLLSLVGMVILAVLGCAISLAVNAAGTMQLLQGLLSDPGGMLAQYQMLISGVGLVVFMAVYAYMRAKHAWVMDLEPEDAINSVGDYFFGEQ